MGFLDTLPQNTADAGQAPYNAKVLNAVIAKQYDAIKWAHVTSTINGHTGKFAVFELPMSFEGIYLAAGAGLLQQIADVTGCMLMTARLADLIYEQSPVRILPYFDFDRNRMMTIEWFRRSTAGINNLIAKAGYTKGPLQNLGKPFILSNLIASSGKSCNYGLYVPASLSPGGVFGGVHTEATVSLPPNQVRVCQGRGTAHGLTQSDYSEIIRLVSRNCVIDGVLMDLADVVRDQTLSALVSVEGPLQIVRQPGVPLVPFVGIGAGPFSDGRDGKTPADFTLTSLPAADGAEEPPPAPLPPAVSPKFLQESSSATPFFIGAAVVATGIAVAVAIRRRRKRRR